MLQENYNKQQKFALSLQENNNLMLQENQSKEEHIGKLKTALKEKMAETKKLTDQLKFQLELNEKLKTSDNTVNDYFTAKIDELTKENVYYKETSE